ncbi:hypothetical protein MCOR34_003936 [Pyricularia oryzae]|uniref:Uncharacterized protein n=1 Tax=Pyricularia oryzae TaxID=318829 RepID=A0A4P7NEG3_PYROR|nr:hypothetical protein MCOR34_003936 [Pyricularia oryzae]KAI6458467.1 hypothetical protein MCOR17_007368 [Pyricularia oryzae]KAI6510861.1 hypothetical protein MCOR13_000784 [Pyricularia oryzae]KAI6577287.1 hypothetical protein MCOR04_006685 [Pyricularia oryzae]QBZ60240.1 hypothetical protein PoMZ_07178 [Pyricularia oryzae]
MSAYWSDGPTYAPAAHTAWHAGPASMPPAYTTCNTYDPDQQYDDDGPAWPSHQLQIYQPATPSQPIQYRHHTHRRKHRRHRPARPHRRPELTHEAQLAAYTAHHLIPALQASPRPVSVLINYGHAAIPESVLTGDGSSSSSIVYNAPGCSLAVVPAESAAENGRGGAGSDNHALLRSCRTCGALRVVDAWGACRDFGARRPLDDSGADWEGGRGGWRRREVGYLAGSPGRFLGW